MQNVSLNMRKLGASLVTILIKQFCKTIFKNCFIMFCKTIFKNSFLKLFYNVLQKKSLFGNLRYFLPIFKYVLKIICMSNVLFLVILYVYKIIIF